MAALISADHFVGGKSFLNCKHWTRRVFNATTPWALKTHPKNTCTKKKKYRRPPFCLWWKQLRLPNFTCYGSCEDWPKLSIPQRRVLRNLKIRKAARCLLEFKKNFVEELILQFVQKPYFWPTIQVVLLRYNRFGSSILGPRVRILKNYLCWCSGRKKWQKNITNNCSLFNCCPSLHYFLWNIHESLVSLQWRWLPWYTDDVCINTKTPKIGCKLLHVLWQSERSTLTKKSDTCELFHFATKQGHECFIQ